PTSGTAHRSTAATDGIIATNTVPSGGIRRPGSARRGFPGRTLRWTSRKYSVIPWAGAARRRPVVTAGALGRWGPGGRVGGRVGWLGRVWGCRRGLGWVARAGIVGGLDLRGFWRWLWRRLGGSRLGRPVVRGRGVRRWR